MMNMIDKIIPKMAESHIYVSPTATHWGNNQFVIISAISGKKISSKSIKVSHFPMCLLQ